MTTIIANRTGMAADKRIVVGDAMFHMPKLYKVGDSIFGLAGDMEPCLEFVKWRKNPESKPTWDDVDFEALELTSAGNLVWWGAQLVPLPMEDDYYAIGTGAGFALGALEMGASLQRAIAVASKWDCKTGPTAQIMRRRVSK